MGNRVHDLLLDYVKRSLSEALKPRTIALYGITILFCGGISFLIPYQTQVYLSIAAGFAVVLLLSVSLVLKRGLRWFDAVFAVGLILLLAGLAQSDLPTKAILESARHASLILSLLLTVLYVFLDISQSAWSKSPLHSVRSLGGFFSVLNTTISSELCSCLHPTLILEALGVGAFLPNQVRLGFMLMMTTVVYQAQSTFESYRSRILEEPKELAYRHIVPFRQESKMMKGRLYSQERP